MISTAANTTEKNGMRIMTEVGPRGGKKSWYQSADQSVSWSGWYATRAEAKSKAGALDR